VCASADVIIVSHDGAERIAVFRRSDGALLTRFGPSGSGDGQLGGEWRGLCLTHRDRRVAVCDTTNHRVSVFSVDGAFVCHVGAGVLTNPYCVASSACDDLVVADTGNLRVRVFSDVGSVLMTFGYGRFVGVTMHGSTLFAVSVDPPRCTVFS
jgi:hypothetical protein